MITSAEKYLPLGRLLPLLLFILSLCVASCGNKEQTITGMQIEKIQIDVFSGRPNPSWKVTAAESAALGPHLIKQTVVACGAEPDTLGYKGFIVTAKSSETANPEQIRVFDGKLWYYSNPLACYKDSDKLESMLIQQAKEKGFAQLMKDLGL
ncbi:MAG: hypothetical protein ABIQ88_02005 [Chitinophagaceae bacterium]